MKQHNGPATDIFGAARNLQRSPYHLEILQVLADQYDHNHDCHHLTFKQIADETGYSESFTRNVVRHLKRKGLVEMSNLFSYEDGMLCGSGHGITTRGRTVLDIVKGWMHPHDKP